MAAAKCLFRALSLGTVFLARICCVVFFIAACFSIPQLRELARNAKFRIESSNTGSKTLFVPLVICDKRSFEYEGHVLLFGDGYDCRPLKYMVTSTTICIALTMTAILIWLFWDTLSRNDIGPMNTTAVRGMTMFLVFSLVQSWACSWALAMQCEYWIDYYRKLFDEREPGYLSHVVSHANPIYLWVVGGSGMVGAIFLLLETAIGIHASFQEKRQHKSNNTQALPQQQEQQQQQKQIQPNVETGEVTSSEPKTDASNLPLETSVPNPASEP